MNDHALPGELYTYIAMCADCRGVIAAMTDYPDGRKRTAKEVAGWIRDGYTAHRVPTVDVKLLTWGHALLCRNKPKAKADQDSFSFNPPGTR